ncbi:MAG: sulfatase-like hydrolase/transferase [Candidatus Brocadiia bacterium]
MAPTRRDFMKTTGLGLLAACPRRLPAQEQGRRKPNVIYFMSDELGYYELSCMGHPHMKTPHVDRLAREGIRFTQGLAGCSVCAPTRCTLMTGKHMGHASVRTNPGGTPLRAEEPTVASMLKKAGYATGGFGKWGCGGRGSTGVPEKHGFDVFFGYYDQVHAHSYYPPYLVRNSDEVPLPGNEGGREGETYSHYVIMEEGLKFIRENRDRPFFCYLCVTPPHGMFDIPDDDPSYALYKDEPWPEGPKVYAAMVHMVDRNVGQVLDLLEELGLERDTIVFFCGDNGGHDYFRSQDHPRGFHGPNVDPETGVAFRGQKGNLYEGGLRIPMLAWWPGRIPGGRVSDLLWYFPDVMPTVAELAGVQPPEDIDGMSIVPTLLGEDAAGREQPQHPYLYWEYGGHTAVRMGQWKAVQPRGKKAWELYDLSQDIAESHDLADQHPDLLAKLKGFAQEAHEPARPGTFQDRELHLKDKRAKWGTSRARVQPEGKAHALPEKGLIPRKDYKLVRASSESRFNAKLAKYAFDADPLTHWHTKFQGGVAQHPHELVIDLGGQHTVAGFRYLARQDRGWNGAIAECELYVGDDPQDFGPPAVKTELKKLKTPQEVTFEPVRGRYVLFRALSEVNGAPWASAAEFGLLGE